MCLCKKKVLYGRKKLRHRRPDGTVDVAAIQSCRPYMKAEAFVADEWCKGAKLFPIKTSSRPLDGGQEQRPGSSLSRTIFREAKVGFDFISLMQEKQTTVVRSATSRSLDEGPLELLDTLLRAARHPILAIQRGSPTLQSIYFWPLLRGISTIRQRRRTGTTRIERLMLHTVSGTRASSMDSEGQPDSSGESRAETAKRAILDRQSTSEDDLYSRSKNVVAC